MMTKLKTIYNKIILFLIIIFLFSSCESDSQPRIYKLKKKKPFIIAAIFPYKKDSDNKFDIYIKFQTDGTTERPSDYEEQFLSICKSGELDTSSTNIFKFSIPEEWNNPITPTKYSIYNVEVPMQSGSAILSISPLPYDENFNQKIEMNYNRWRKQLKKPALESELIYSHVKQDTTTTDIGNKFWWFVIE